MQREKPDKAGRGGDDRQDNRHSLRALGVAAAVAVGRCRYRGGPAEAVADHHGDTRGHFLQCHVSENDGDDYDADGGPKSLKATFS